MAATLPPPILDQISAVLARVPLFECLSGPELQRIAGLVRARTIEPGEILFKQGDPADRLFIVESGAIELIAAEGEPASNGNAIKRPGEALDELALLAAEPRAATARARERTNLLVIPRAPFTELLSSDTMAANLVVSVARSLMSLSLRGYNLSLQSTLLPPEAPQTAEFEIAGALARGGNGGALTLWDAFPLKGGGIIYAVISVSGNSLAPAHVLATTRALLREIAASEERFERVLTRLNKAIHGNIGPAPDTYVSVGLMHLVSVITFAVAGDHAATVIKADGERIDIERHGPPIGVAVDYSYGTTRAELDAADCALVLTTTDPAMLNRAGLTQGQTGALAELAPAIAASIAHAHDDHYGADVAVVVARRS